MYTNLETEIKLASSDLARFRDAGLELTLVKPRHFEDNWLVDLPDQMLLRKGAALRIRSAEGRGFITYKGTVRESNSLVKMREEIESEISEPDRVLELFERLGFRRSFRYQKYRTVFSLALNERQLEISLDETPIGNFIEIEGEEQAVVRVVEAAGFAVDDIIRQSYPELQAARCGARGVPLEDLVFGR